MIFFHGFEFVYLFASECAMATKWSGTHDGEDDKEKLQVEMEWQFKRKNKNIYVSFCRWLGRVSSAFRTACVCGVKYRALGHFSCLSCTISKQRRQSTATKNTFYVFYLLWLLLVAHTDIHAVKVSDLQAYRIQSARNAMTWMCSLVRRNGNDGAYTSTILERHEKWLKIVSAQSYDNSRFAGSTQRRRMTISLASGWSCNEIQRKWRKCAQSKLRFRGNGIPLFILEFLIYIGSLWTKREFAKQVISSMVTQHSASSDM